MHYEINSDLRAKIEAMKTQLKTQLPQLENLSKTQTKSIVKRYTAVFEGNFIGWMSSVTVTARSVLTRFFASENLHVELSHDHAGLLRKFSTACDATPGDEDLRATSTSVEQIRDMLSEVNGLKNTTLLAVLENSSTTFIPLLESIATSFGSNELTYTQIHGEADIDHAEQFLMALSAEYNEDYDNHEALVDETIQTCLNLLFRIFSTEVEVAQAA